ncbi:hypothetical protein [Streptomyces sp. NPDC002788]
MLGPGGEIFAIEPTRIMRAALVTRLSRIAAAADTVTVLPEGALEAEVDLPLDAVVLFNMVMHFSPEQRVRLWRKWSGALRPGGLLIMESQHPQAATAVPPSVILGSTLGRHRYDTLARAEVQSEDLIRWMMTYRTWRGDELIREETARFDCHVVSQEVTGQQVDDVVDVRLGEERQYGFRGEEVRAAGVRGDGLRPRLFRDRRGDHRAA